MSFFKNAMASVLGIGGAKINTVLNADTLTPGQEVRGVVRVQGGSVTQNVKRVDLKVCTTYEKETDNRKSTLKGTVQTVSIPEVTTITAGKSFEIPFSFKLSLSCPISTSRNRVWIESELEIENAIDPGDRDYINVRPNYEMQVILRALENLGFRSREIENVEGRFNSRYFEQEFEFVANRGEFVGHLDELEVVFNNNEYGMDLKLEVDRRARNLGGLLKEALNMDESKLRLSFTRRQLEDENTVKSILEDTIRRYI